MLVQGALQQAVDLQLQQTSSLLPHRAAAPASSMLALLQDDQWQNTQSLVLQDSREQAAFAVAEHMMKAAQHALQEAAVLPGAGAELQGSCCMIQRVSCKIVTLILSGCQCAIQHGRTVCETEQEEGALPSSPHALQYWP